MGVAIDSSRVGALSHTITTRTQGMSSAELALKTVAPLVHSTMALVAKQSSERGGPTFETRRRPAGHISIDRQGKVVGPNDNKLRERYENVLKRGFRRDDDRLGTSFKEKAWIWIPTTAIGWQKQVLFEGYVGRDPRKTTLAAGEHRQSIGPLKFAFEKVYNGKVIDLDPRSEQRGTSAPVPHPYVPGVKVDGEHNKRACAWLRSTLQLLRDVMSRKQGSVVQTTEAADICRLLGGTPHTETVRGTQDNLQARKKAWSSGYPVTWNEKLSSESDLPDLRRNKIMFQLFLEHVHAPGAQVYNYRRMLCYVGGGIATANVGMASAIEALVKDVFFEHPFNSDGMLVAVIAGNEQRKVGLSIYGGGTAIAVGPKIPPHTYADDLQWPRRIARACSYSKTFAECSSGLPHGKHPACFPHRHIVKVLHVTYEGGANRRLVDRLLMQRDELKPLDDAIKEVAADCLEMKLLHKSSENGDYACVATAGSNARASAGSAAGNTGRRRINKSPGPGERDDMRVLSKSEIQNQVFHLRIADALPLPRALLFAQLISRPTQMTERLQKDLYFIQRPALLELFAAINTLTSGKQLSEPANLAKMELFETPEKLKDELVLQNFQEILLNSYLEIDLFSTRLSPSASDVSLPAGLGDYVTRALVRTLFPASRDNASANESYKGAFAVRYTVDYLSVLFGLLHVYMTGRRGMTLKKLQYLKQNLKNARNVTNNRKATSRSSGSQLMSVSATSNNNLKNLSKLRALGIRKQNAKLHSVLQASFEGSKTGKKIFSLNELLKQQNNVNTSNSQLPKVVQNYVEARKKEAGLVNSEGGFCERLIGLSHASRGQNGTMTARLVGGTKVVRKGLLQATNNHSVHLPTNGLSEMFNELELGDSQARALKVRLWCLTKEYVTMLSLSSGDGLRPALLTALRNRGFLRTLLRSNPRFATAYTMLLRNQIDIIDASDVNVGIMLVAAANMKYSSTNGGKAKLRGRLWNNGKFTKNNGNNRKNNNNNNNTPMNFTASPNSGSRPSLQSATFKSLPSRNGGATNYTLVNGLSKRPNTKHKTGEQRGRRGRSLLVNAVNAVNQPKNKNLCDVRALTQEKSSCYMAAMLLLLSKATQLRTKLASDMQPLLDSVNSTKRVNQSVCLRIPSGLMQIYKSYIAGIKATEMVKSRGNLNKVGGYTELFLLAAFTHSKMPCVFISMNFKEFNLAAIDNSGHTLTENQKRIPAMMRHVQTAITYVAENTFPREPGRELSMVSAKFMIESMVRRAPNIVGGFVMLHGEPTGMAARHRYHAIMFTVCWGERRPNGKQQVSLVMCNSAMAEGVGKCSTKMSDAVPFSQRYKVIGITLVSHKPTGVPWSNFVQPLTKHGLPPGRDGTHFAMQNILNSGIPLIHPEQLAALSKVNDIGINNIGTNKAKVSRHSSSSSDAPSNSSPKPNNATPNTVNDATIDKLMLNLTTPTLSKNQLAAAKQKLNALPWQAKARMLSRVKMAVQADPNAAKRPNVIELESYLRMDELMGKVVTATNNTEVGNYIRKLPAADKQRLYQFVRARAKSDEGIMNQPHVKELMQYLKNSGARSASHTSANGNRPNNTSEAKNDSKSGSASLTNNNIANISGGGPAFISRVQNKIALMNALTRGSPEERQAAADTISAMSAESKEKLLRWVKSLKGASKLPGVSEMKQYLTQEKLMRNLVHANTPSRKAAANKRFKGLKPEERNRLYEYVKREAKRNPNVKANPVVQNVMKQLRGTRANSNGSTNGPMTGSASAVSPNDSPPIEYKKGDRVCYTGQRGSKVMTVPATVVKVHHNAIPKYYTIGLLGQSRKTQERETNGDRLSEYNGSCANNDSAGNTSNNKSMRSVDSPNNANGNGATDNTALYKLMHNRVHGSATTKAAADASIKALPPTQQEQLLRIIKNAMRANKTLKTNPNVDDVLEHLDPNGSISVRSGGASYQDIAANEKAMENLMGALVRNNEGARTTIAGLKPLNKKRLYNFVTKRARLNPNVLNQKHVPELMAFLDPQDHKLQQQAMQALMDALVKNNKRAINKIKSLDVTDRKRLYAFVKARTNANPNVKQQPHVEALLQYLKPSKEHGEDKRTRGSKQGKIKKQAQARQKNWQKRKSIAKK